MQFQLDVLMQVTLIIEADSLTALQNIGSFRLFLHFSSKIIIFRRFFYINSSKKTHLYQEICKHTIIKAKPPQAYLEKMVNHKRKKLTHPVVHKKLTQGCSRGQATNILKNVLSFFILFSCMNRNLSEAKWNISLTQKIKIVLFLSLGQ